MKTQTIKDAQIESTNPQGCTRCLCRGVILNKRDKKTALDSTYRDHEATHEGYSSDTYYSDSHPCVVVDSHTSVVVSRLFDTYGDAVEFISRRRTDGDTRALHYRKV